MSQHIEPIPHPDSGLVVYDQLPGIVAQAGPRAGRRFVEFFTAEIENDHTRAAYARAIARFLMWCEGAGLTLEQIEPILVATYIKRLGRQLSKTSVKQHLAAIRHLFDYLVTGQVIPFNPAASVRGPKHKAKRGKTPVLSAEDTRRLLDSIPTTTVVGLRDRALLGVMVYSFARVSAVLGMRVRDYYPNGKRWWFRLLEKGGKHHEVPAHHTAEEYMDAYLDAAQIREESASPLFQSANRFRRLTGAGLHRSDVFAMIRRRARAAGIATQISCHTFRATGITNFLENGGSLEHAQQIAAHESPRTTKLYDRRNDQITLDEIERIQI